MKQCLQDAENLATHSNRREQLFCIRPADRMMSKLPPETSRPSVYTRPEVHWVYSTTAALATPLLRSLVMHGNLRRDPLLARVPPVHPDTGALTKRRQPRELETYHGFCELCLERNLEC